VKGLSTTTCLPASSAARTSGKCALFGVLDYEIGIPADRRGRGIGGARHPHQLQGRDGPDQRSVEDLAGEPSADHHRADSHAVPASSSRRLRPRVSRPA
jgi:hypothetical protein